MLQVQIIYLFLSKVWYLCFFWEFDHFMQVISFVGILLFIAFLYHPFISVHSVVILSFLPDFSNLSHLFFFLVILAEYLSVLLIFSRNQLLVSLIFCILLILALIFIIFILLLASGSVRLSFFQFPKVENQVIDLRTFCFLLHLILFFFLFKYIGDSALTISLSTASTASLVCRVSLFLHLKVFADLSFDFFFNLLVQDDIRLASKHIKGCSTSYVIKKLQIKTIKYHHTLTRMAEIQNTDNT